MLGPCKKRMPDKYVCSECDYVISKELGGTPKFPKKRIINYCSHPDLETQVCYIKKFPLTPAWCPVLGQ